MRYNENYGKKLGLKIWKRGRNWLQILKETKNWAKCEKNLEKKTSNIVNRQKMKQICCHFQNLQAISCPFSNCQSQFSACLVLTFLTPCDCLVRFQHCRSGWPATEGAASTWGKTKWACSHVVSRQMLFVGMIWKSAPPSELTIYVWKWATFRLFFPCTMPDSECVKLSSSQGNDLDAFGCFSNSLGAQADSQYHCQKKNIRKFVNLEIQIWKGSWAVSQLVQRAEIIVAWKVGVDEISVSKFRFLHQTAAVRKQELCASKSCVPTQRSQISAWVCSSALPCTLD